MTPEDFLTKVCDSDDIRAACDELRRLGATFLEFRRDDAARVSELRGWIKRPDDY